MIYTDVCKCFCSETHSHVCVFCPLQPVFPCQQTARRGESQLWLRQNEHTWDVVLLVLVGQLQMETRVQFNDRPADGRRAQIMRLLERAFGGVQGTAGGLCQHILASFSSILLLSAPHVRFTSPLLNYSRWMIEAKHWDTGPQHNHDAPPSPKIAYICTCKHEQKAFSLILFQAPGCRCSQERRWPTVGGLLILGASGASIKTL